MTVIGLDDTDSRELGMCTTYLAARVAERVGAERLVLVRLNPAVEYKTRGNAALAVHTDCDPETAFEVASEEVARAAEVEDPRTNPGLVVAPGDPEDVPDEICDFARRAVRELLTSEEADAKIESAGYQSEGWKNERGKIGALAAVGAWAAGAAGAEAASPRPLPEGESADESADSTVSEEVFDDWTHERISYRESDQWGTPRDVDAESVFDAANEGYPDVWDTVDRETGQLVCVPHTPGPILHGIRGDDPDAVRQVANEIDGEAVERTATFVTNQGTDAHLRDATLREVEDGHAYRVEGTVTTEPETHRGGHVFFDLRDGGEEGDEGGESELRCAAFEPTKRFRDRVRSLREGDRIVACGEVSDGTLKLEKFAVRDLSRTELVTPDCPNCGRSMKSAGAEQGYRCRNCKTTAPGKVEREVERELEFGWYEVPPEARRHISKPLVRGGFDAPIHPEK
ncbi:tRNA(Ile)(2)-agmatinylcytidine synthase [Halorussus halophilus]|uniref:tRNA(Ile)(2)-agmatinylcytidine synthase n=1 Tax=Halorussus halophilus TaxID=2650975 RepID=UPI0013015E5B|nr:tRNA(Ile)(2)-agmatinylcytidine synthase [Halorussus halophilus]